MALNLLGVAIAVTDFVLSGCATMRVSSHVERGLDKNPFFRDQVEGAIERQMAARGFERSAVSETSDVRIHLTFVLPESSSTRLALWSSTSLMNGPTG